MPRNKAKDEARQQREVAELLQYAISKPQGFTRQEAYGDLNWSREKFGRVSRRFRKVHGQDTFNLVCSPNGKGQEWLYTLAGTYEDSRPWLSNREKDMMARLGTAVGVAEAIVNATDGRTLTGRKARLVHSTLSNLLVQVEMLESQV